MAYVHYLNIAGLFYEKGMCCFRIGDENLVE